MRRNRQCVTTSVTVLALKKFLVGNYNWMTCINFRGNVSSVSSLIEHCLMRDAGAHLKSSIRLLHASPDCSTYAAIGFPCVISNNSHEWQHIWWTLGEIIVEGKLCLWWSISLRPRERIFSGITIFWLLYYRVILSIWLMQWRGYWNFFDDLCCLQCCKLYHRALG